MSLRLCNIIIMFCVLLYSVCVIICRSSAVVCIILSFDLLLRIVIRHQTLDYYVTSVMTASPLYIPSSYWDDDDLRSQHFTTQQALSSGVTKTTYKPSLA